MMVADRWTLPQHHERDSQQGDAIRPPVGTVLSIGLNLCCGEVNLAWDHCGRKG